MRLLAGLEVTGKAIERAAEAMGTQIARRDQQEIGRAKQLVLPVASEQNIPKMYVLIDGVQVPVVAAATEGRTGRVEGRCARTRECKLGCVFTQTTVDREGWPTGCAIRSFGQRDSSLAPAWWKPAASPLSDHA
jgi:hypothetical protein